ncbi:MAG: hypothetical protein V7K88_24050 [Nostoc sp.]|uniref:hypothetical protein n=1 Tax=Nostoc sp. TaxID=1180 RepID=UPI002FFC9D73
MGHAFELKLTPINHAVPLRGSKLARASRREVRAMSFAPACRRQDSLTLLYETLRERYRRR